MKKLILLSILAFTLSVNAQIPGYVPTSGLVGWWPFNGNANDESGNGNNGTVNGAVLTNDRFGNVDKAYSFDGVSNFIEAASNSNLQISTAYTISLWFNANIFNNGIYGYTLISKIASTGWYGGYEIMIGGISPPGGVNHTGNISSNFQLPYVGMYVGNWYSVIVTFDGNQLKLYVDGSLVNTLTQPGALQIGNDPLRFGRRGGGGIYDQWYNGKLDDIGIWNRALTECEIQQLYNASFLSSSQAPSICNGSSVTVGLNTYDSTGVYTDTLTSVNGCDSIVTTDLLVLQDSTSTLSPTICQGSSFTVGDSTYNADGIYTNVFTASNGCDSIVTTNLTVLDCSGIEDALLNQVNIYPNPANNQISLIIPEKLIGKPYQILDYSGRQIRTGLLTEVNSMIDISSIAKGVYIIQIGEQKLSLKLVKE